MPPDITIKLPPDRRMVTPDAPGKIQILAAEVTVREFATATGYTERSVQRLCDEDQIKARKRNPGKDYSEWLIPVAELKRFLGNAG